MKSVDKKTWDSKTDTQSESVMHIDGEDAFIVKDTS